MLTILLLLIITSFSGKASWYGERFHGKRTASGAIFNMNKYTCAHRTLPFGTKILVKRGNKSVIVKTIDRGPTIKNRVIDLSKAAARKLNISGVSVVNCTVLR